MSLPNSPHRSSTSLSHHAEYETPFKDVCSRKKQEIVYSKLEDSNRFTSKVNHPASSNYSSFLTFMKDVFLPEGYPESVSEDYLEYQVWDTCQAFCSSITGTLSIRAVLQGVGVGSNTASPASAAISWIMKDGTGMVGSIFFAWSKGSKLDTECKKWRLFADVLNDIAMCLELFIPHMLQYSLYALCAASALKALVGVAGGATRAALTSHQAIRHNTADVSAKDRSQEIFVNLCAMAFGIFLLKAVTKTEHVWMVMCTFTILHLLFNYKAVRCLKMYTLNGERYRLTLRSYLVTSSIPTATQVNRNESVILGRGNSNISLFGYDIVLGSSLKHEIVCQKLTVEDMAVLVTFFQDKNYFLIPYVERRKISVSFRTNFSCKDVLKAYFHAVVLAIAMSSINSDTKLAVLERKRNNSPIGRLCNLLRIYLTTKSIPYQSAILPSEAFYACDEIIDREFDLFHEQLGKQNWNTDKHSLFIGSWRGEWLYVHVVKPLLDEVESPPPKKHSKHKGSRKHTRSASRRASVMSYKNVVLA